MKATPVPLTSSASRAASLLFIFLGAFLSDFGLRHAVANDPTTLRHVLDAWRNRERHVKSLRFRWTEDHFQAKGTLELPPDQRQKGAAFPPRDTTYRVKSTCEMDRDMMRYGFSGESLQVYNEGALEHREYVSASDGVVSRAFWPIPNKLRAYPKGITFDDKICCDASTLEVKPLLWIYRALDPRFAFSESSLRLSPNDESIDHITCKIVYFEKGGVRHSIWTDPARDFLPLRLTIGLRVTGDMTTRTDIAYRLHPPHGWTPTNWKTVRPAAGDVRSSVVARVLESAINIEIPREHFQIKFPPGSVVIDMSNKGERYLVGADGSKQVPSDARDQVGANVSRINQ
jgi:hypothetical protein